MKLNTLITLFFIGGIFMISCKDSKSATNENLENQKIQKTKIDAGLLIGAWEDQSESALHFSLYENGSAKSDNMATLLYQNWRFKDNQLYLIAESIGNRTSSAGTEIYEIQKLDENQMTLKRGEIIYECKKINKNNGGAFKGEQNPMTLKGQITFGHEARSFEPCGSDLVVWVSDTTGELGDLYNELTKGEEPYTPIYAEIVFIDKGKAVDGFSADYDSEYEVVQIIKTRKISDKDCD